MKTKIEANRGGDPQKYQYDLWPNGRMNGLMNG